MTNSGISKLFDWLRVNAPRTPRAPRQAYAVKADYWDGGVSAARRVRNVSITGAYIETPDRWYPGTVLNITLQAEHVPDGSADGPKPVTVACRVVRLDVHGMGVQFVFEKPQQRKVIQQFLAKVGLRNVPTPANNEAGQSLIEFALMVPLIFLLIINAINFGGFFYAWVTMSSATRIGAQYEILGSASATSPQLATASTLSTIITAETSSLPSSATYCLNTNSTSSAVTGTCSLPSGFASSTFPSIPADPEAPTYELVALDTYYTYTPFIPLFSFPVLGVYATIPPTQIHQRTLMRVIQ